MSAPQDFTHLAEVQDRVPGTFPLAARASVVNRTHRVVREQALGLRAARSRSRSLWLPLGICSSLLAVLCFAVWFFLDGPDVATATPDAATPDAGNQLMLLLLWSLPITVALIGVAVLHLRRSGEVSQ
jgi:hypothetical protein